MAGWEPRAAPAAPPQPALNTTVFKPGAIKHGNFPINHGHFPIKHGNFPINHGHFPIKHERFPIIHGRFSINHGRFSIDHGHSPINHGHSPINQVHGLSVERKSKRMPLPEALAAMEARLQPAEKIGAKPL